MEMRNSSGAQESKSNFVKDAECIGNRTEGLWQDAKTEPGRPAIDDTNVLVRIPYSVSHR